MKFEVPDLPYAKNALEPYISARTLEIHYEKHHKGYMSKLRKQIEGKPEAEQDLTDLIRNAKGSLYNNAAQVWNHTFYWRSMSPNGGKQPDGKVREAIDAGFGSLGAFKKELAGAANGEFGSGWAWLIKNESGLLEVVNSSDAENPLQRDQVPLLTLDVWEHAYYLDYQNERNRYVEGVIDNLLNWDFIAENL